MKQQVQLIDIWTKTVAIHLKAFSVFLNYKLNATTISAIKKELHHYIGNADNGKLKAMYLLLEKDIAGTNYSEEELSKFYNIPGKNASGELETFSVEMAHH